MIYPSSSIKGNKGYHTFSRMIYLKTKASSIVPLYNPSLNPFNDTVKYIVQPQNKNICWMSE